MYLVCRKHYLISIQLQNRTSAGRTQMHEYQCPVRTEKKERDGYHAARILQHWHGMEYALRAGVRFPNSGSILGVLTPDWYLIKYPYAILNDVISFLL